MNADPDHAAPALAGSPFVAYRQGRLHVEDVAVDALAAQHGTPLFIYSRAAVLAAVASYQKGLAGRQAMLCYAVKANPSLALLKLMADAGCGFDIVSSGELQRVLAVGAAPEKIVFSGVGKTRDEMRLALQAGIGCFNVESTAELQVLDEVARQCGRKAPVSLRVNPDVDARTHPYIATGLQGNKFGIAHDAALAAYREAAAREGLQVVGVDCHIGSQIVEIAPYVEALDRVLDLVAELQGLGIHLSHIDMGGGLGIRYADETPPAPHDLLAAVWQRLEQRGMDHHTLIVEPGRSLVGNAGLCVTDVLYLKTGGQKNFCIVDAAMNDLPRPALYQAFHDIVPTQRPPAHARHLTWDVVGPVCESGDWLGRDRQLAVQAGDRLAVLSAGAYCMSMACNYNTRPRAAEILVSENSSWLIRRRESLADLLQQEIMPNCG